MAKCLINESTFQDIANALNEKNPNITLNYDSPILDFINGLESINEDVGIALSLISGNCPSSLSDDTVTSINTSIISNFSNITSVSFPNCESITSSYTFNKSSSGSAITTIDLPKLQSITGDEVFYKYPSKSISLPLLESISGNLVFYQCASLTSLTLPELKSIYGHNTVHDCDSILSIDLPKLTKITIDYTNSTYTQAGIFSSLGSCTTINLPELSEIEILGSDNGAALFKNSSAITTVTIGKLARWENNLLSSNPKLTTVDAGIAEFIDYRAIGSSKLKVLKLHNTETMCQTNAASIPTIINNNRGYIQVAKSLLDQYIADQYWGTVNNIYGVF